MIKYISSSSYRKYYDFLESYKMFSSKFYNICMGMMRNQLRTQFYAEGKTSKNIRSILQIQIKKASTPQTRIKTLWLIHLFLQLLKVEEIQAMEDEFMSHINILLAAANRCSLRNSSLKAANGGFLGVMKASMNSNQESGKSQSSSKNKSQIPSVKSIISIPTLPKFKIKDTGEEIVKVNSSYGKDYKEEEADDLRRSKGSSIAQSWSLKPQLEEYCANSSSGSKQINKGSTEVKKQKIDGDQFFDSNIAVPYANFLSKYLNWKIHSNITTVQKLDMKQSWTLINMYTLMLKASDCFLKAIRYFKEPNIFLSVMSVQVFHFDISTTYKKLQKSILARMEDIQKEFHPIMAITSKTEKIEELQDLLEKYDIRDMKELITQLAGIHQKLILLYQNKYVRDIISQRDVLAPNYIETETGPGELIHSIIQLYNKEVKTNVKRNMKLKHKGSLSLISDEDLEDFGIRSSHGCPVLSKSDYRGEQSPNTPEKDRQDIRKQLMAKTTNFDDKHLLKTRRPSVIDENQGQQSQIDVDLEDLPISDQNIEEEVHSPQEESSIDMNDDEAFIFNLPESSEFTIEEDTCI